MISASSLDRIAACPGSVHLPQTRSISEASERGTVVHRFLSECITIGADAAIENVPDKYVELCGALDLAKLPVAPGGYASEVAFAWHSETDTARELGRGTDRDYSALEPGELPGTVDVIGVAEDAVVVYDYKGAWSQAESATTNRQLRTYALMACRAYGKSKAHVGIIRLRDDGALPWYDRALFDAMDLDAIAVETAEIMRRAVADKSIVLGPHCRYCPAVSHCPAQRSNFGELATGTPMLEITASNAATVLLRWQAANRAMESIEDALKAYAATQPIELPDGKVWGPVEETRESVNGEIARGVLGSLYGSEVAMAATQIKTSKTAIKAALKAVAPKGHLAGMEREALEEVRKRGGITISTIIKHAARARKLEGASK